MADNYYSLVGIHPPEETATPGPDAGLAPPRPPNPPGVLTAPQGKPQGTVAPQPGPAPTTPAPATAAPGVPGPVPMVPQVHLPHIPRPHEIPTYPGAQIQTPYGPVISDPRTGEHHLHFTPEGRTAYANEIVKMRRRMGPHPVAGDPRAPQMQLVPGRVGYDPFNGRYFS